MHRIRVVGALFASGNCLGMDPHLLRFALGRLPALTPNFEDSLRATTVAAGSYAVSMAAFSSMVVSHMRDIDAPDGKDLYFPIVVVGAGASARASVRSLERSGASTRVLVVAEKIPPFSGSLPSSSVDQHLFAADSPFRKPERTPVCTTLACGMELCYHMQRTATHLDTSKNVRI